MRQKWYLKSSDLFSCNVNNYSVCLHKPQPIHLLQFQPQSTSLWLISSRYMEPNSHHNLRDLSALLYHHSHNQGLRELHQQHTKQLLFCFLPSPPQPARRLQIYIHRTKLNITYGTIPAVICYAADEKETEGIILSKENFYSMGKTGIKLSIELKL